MDFDLMMQEYDRWVHSTVGQHSAPLGIAVVEKGLDPALLGKVDASKITTSSVHGESLLNSIRQTEHGLEVTSTVQRFNPDAKIRVYSSESADGRIEIDAATVLASFDAACNQGYKIINASEASLPAFDQDFDKRHSDLFKSLAKRGCLVVKAAGNLGDWSTLENNNLDDAILIVGSSRETGVRTNFSNLGEIYAPGERIVVASTGFANGYPNDPQQCFNLDPNNFMNTPAVVDGTSFSAPITAALLSRLGQVLRTQPAFLLLPGESQVALLNRILKASEQGLGINAYRAFKMAEIYDGGLLSVEELKQKYFVASRADCTRATVSPLVLSGNGSCQSVEDLALGLRTRLALCQTLNGNDAQVVKDLASSPALETVIPRVLASGIDPLTASTVITSTYWDQALTWTVAQFNFFDFKEGESPIDLYSLARSFKRSEYDPHDSIAGRYLVSYLNQFAQGLLANPQKNTAQELLSSSDGILESVLDAASDQHPKSSDNWFSRLAEAIDSASIPQKSERLDAYVEKLRSKVPLEEAMIKYLSEIAFLSSPQTTSANELVTIISSNTINWSSNDLSMLRAQINSLASSGKITSQDANSILGAISSRGH